MPRDADSTTSGSKAAITSRSSGRRRLMVGPRIGPTQRLFSVRVQGRRALSSADQPRTSATLPRWFHKTVEYHLPPGLVEIDGELVAVDGGDRAGAEFLVED